MAATAALKARPPASETARRAVRARTIPEQIADHVAVAIIKGEFRDGEHLPEQRSRRCSTSATARCAKPSARYRSAALSSSSRDAARS